MALTRWDPFGEMLKMQRDMDRIFSRTGTSGGQATMTTSWMPRINVKQSGEDLTMQVELAGIKPEDVDIEVTDGVLSVHGQRSGETEREDEGWIVRESSFGEFERAMVLPEGVDPNSIQADFHDGMLDVRIPKAMKAMQPQTTKIAIGGQAGHGQAQGGQMGQGQTETVQSPEMAQMGTGGTQYGGQGGMEGQRSQESERMGAGQGMQTPEMSGMSGQSPIPDSEEQYEKPREEQSVGRRW